MLDIKELHAYYGRIEALHGVSLTVNDKEIVALIGSNGAGKTTLINSVSGHITKSGQITFDGRDITALPPHKIARINLLQVPEGRHVFPGLSVEQNLMVGTTADKGVRLAAGNNSETLEMVYSIFPRLKERHKQLAWSLSGGEQQMLAIGRALMGKPKLLMLDEPSMGLAPLIIEELFEKIIEINKNGTPILLVEQNAYLALSVSQRAYILERGRITLSGQSCDLLQDDRVMEAYLGKQKAK